MTPAEALFEEWEGELTQYSSPSLRASSEKQLTATRDRYDRLMVVMRKAESGMDPVLDAFRDQVLFLKHNLNAQAISSLQDEASKIENDVDGLIADMEASIKEADAFIQVLLGAAS